MPSSNEIPPAPSLSDVLGDPDRLGALRTSGLLDAEPDEAFDRLTRLVQRALSVPVSLVSLLDRDRQFFLSQQGLEEPWRSERETPLSHSFCQHVVVNGLPLNVADARTHDLVRDNLAIRDLGVVAYLGVPVYAENGAVLGSLCAIDSVPRAWTDADLNTLQDVARTLESGIALRHELERRKQAERDLGERESLLRLAVDAALFGAWSTDLTTGTSYWDARCREIFGVAPEEPATAERRIALTHPEDRARAQEALERAQASDDGLYRVEKRVVHADGAVRWVSSWGRVFKDADGLPERIIGLSADVTERRAMTELLHERGRELEELNASLESRVEKRTAALRARSEQVRALTRALTLAEQAERRRLAHVLHDDLQQLLFGTQLQVQATAQRTEQSAPLDYISDLLDRALELTRTLSHELAPPALDEDGLEIGLAWLADQFETMHGLAVDFDVDAPCPVPDRSLRALLIQIVRELLFNVVKHAGADQADLRLRCEDDRIEITVSDRGRGFDPAHVQTHSDGAFGLRSVQERVELIGGRFILEGQPGDGTRATLQVARAGGDDLA